MTKKLTKDEFWEELNPDKLNLEKQDLLNFCYSCLDEWKKNKIANFKYLLAMELMISSIKLTPENILKTIWKKIILWFYDLTYQNALANTKDNMLKEIRKIGSRKD
tara:strand:- start:123 stop:440 length:318 start_codon:yes stop_codon:yes gene_type:complete